MPGRMQRRSGLRRSPMGHSRWVGRPISLPRIIPGGYLAGGIPGRRLVSALRPPYWPCAPMCASGTLLLCPHALTLAFAESPPQLCRDINDTRRERWVLVRIVVLFQLLGPIHCNRRRLKLLLWRVQIRWRARVLRMRGELCPRRIALGVRHGSLVAYVWVW